MTPIAGLRKGAHCFGDSARPAGGKVPREVKIVEFDGIIVYRGPCSYSGYSRFGFPQDSKGAGGIGRSSARSTGRSERE